MLSITSLSLEAYTTPLDDDDCEVDEYNIFKEMLAGLQTANPAWYTQLTGHLSEVQGKALAEVGEIRLSSSPDLTS